MPSELPAPYYQLPSHKGGILENCFQPAVEPGERVILGGLRLMPHNQHLQTWRIGIRYRSIHLSLFAPVSKLPVAIAL
jgi:hypothetical protein